MINGIINVYKEKGFTSFDVVAIMRGIAGQKKVGHTGTLDPDAEGVLPVCLGNATKLCDMLTDKKKEYVATFLLGVKTDTLDISGKELERKEPSVSKEELIASIKSFIGGYNQLPPMYSAKKINGKKLYDLAREGKEVERKPAFVEIFDIEVVDISYPYYTIRVLCGKGTYIRSLGEDIAAKCNELSVMTSLKRTKVSEFTDNDALTIAALKQLKEEGRLNEVVKPTETAFSDLKALTVLKDYRKLIDNGNKLELSMVSPKCELMEDEKVRIYNDDNIFTGVFRFNKADNILVPFKMFKEEM